MIKTQDRPKDITHFKLYTPHSPFSGNSTYSTLLLTPAFDLDLNRPVYNYLVGCYIDDFGIKHNFTRPLFVLLRTRVFDRHFFAIDSLMKDNKFFVYSYAVGSNYEDYLFMYVYECPARYADDYDRFLKGEYSQFSESYKKKFGRLIPHNGRAVESPVYGFLHKTQTARERLEIIIGEKVSSAPTQEYLSVPVMEYEVFRFHN